jgi:hypothetical protein
MGISSTLSNINPAADMSIEDHEKAEKPVYPQDTDVDTPVLLNGSGSSIHSEDVTLPRTLGVYSGIFLIGESEKPGVD